MRTNKSIIEEVEKLNIMINKSTVTPAQYNNMKKQIQILLGLIPTYIILNKGVYNV